jgi:ribosomal protein S18 acetylase RimI-like enzyme
MCIRPEYRDRGIGKAMLHRIKNIALENGCKTLTLGTEPEMKAYQLYQNHGFMVTAEHTVEL